MRRTIPRQRRFPRSEIIPPVKPRSDLTAYLTAFRDWQKNRPTPVWCEAIYSVGLPGSEFALPGWQFCALRHGHDGPHLLDAYDGTRFWFDPETQQSTWDNPKEAE